METAWERFKIESAWGWLVDDPELRGVIRIRIRELEEAKVKSVEQTLKEERLLMKELQESEWIIYGKI